MKTSIQRPLLPLFLIPLGALWCGIFAAEELAWAQQLSSLPQVAYGVLAGALFLITLIVVIWRRQIVLLSVLSLVLGFALGGNYWTNAERMSNDYIAQQSNNGQTNVNQLVQITSDPKSSSIGYSSDAEVILPYGARLPARLNYSSSQTPLSFGQVVQTGLTFSKLDKKDNTHSLYRAGILGNLKLAATESAFFETSPTGWIYQFRHYNELKINAAVDAAGELTNWTSSLISNVSNTTLQDGANLLQGVLLGYASPLQGTAPYLAFQTTGLAHLVAVSGSHLAIIASIVVCLLALLQTSRRSRFVVLLLFLVAYVFLTGLQPSAIRSAIMAIACHASFFVGRRAHAPSAVSIAAYVMLLFDPTNAFSIGFWLSVFAVIGITMFGKYVEEWIDHLLTRKATAAANASSARPLRLRRLRELVKGQIKGPAAITLTAQAATTPITVPIFATLPLLSPLANLIMTPLITALLGGGIAVLVLGNLPILSKICDFLLQILLLLGQFCGLVAEGLSSIPYSAVPATGSLPLFVTVAIVVFTLIYWRWAQPSARLARALICCALGLSIFVGFGLNQFKPAQFVVMDIGQGDALLLRDDAAVIGVDTGPSQTAYKAALARQNVTHLDALIITHLDADHCGSLLALVGTVSVNHIYFAKGLLTSHTLPGKAEGIFNEALQALNSGVDKSRQLEEIGVGDELRLGSHLLLEVVWPKVPAVEGGNAESLTLYMSIDFNADGVVDKTALLTGDAEKAELLEMQHTTLRGRRVDIYKVGHHGSANALTPELMQDFQFSYAFISCGLNNRYGHPKPTTLDILIAGGAQIYRTDQQGDITLNIKPTGIEVVV